MTSLQKLSILFNIPHLGDFIYNENTQTNEMVTVLSTTKFNMAPKIIICKWYQNKSPKRKL
jgi:hypothetical protein